MRLVPAIRQLEGVRWKAGLEVKQGLPQLRSATCRHDTDMSTQEIIKSFSGSSKPPPAQMCLKCEACVCAFSGRRAS